MSEETKKQPETEQEQAAAETKAPAAESDKQEAEPAAEKTEKKDWFGKKSKELEAVKAKLEAAEQANAKLKDQMLRTAALARVQAGGGNLAAEMKAQGIWEAKQAPFKRALQRHASPARWDRFVAEASKIDRTAKGRGEGDAWVALERLLAAGFTVPLVLTQPDRPAGRGMKLAPSAVKQPALKRGLEVDQPEKLRTDAQRARLLACAPDVLVVAAYGLILPPAVLELPRLGCINIHASLLPRALHDGWVHEVERELHAPDVRLDNYLPHAIAGLSGSRMAALASDDGFCLARVGYSQDDAETLCVAAADFFDFVARQKQRGFRGTGSAVSFHEGIDMLMPTTTFMLFWVDGTGYWLIVGGEPLLNNRALVELIWGIRVAGTKFAVQ